MAVDQSVLAAEGLTQASRGMPLVRCSRVLSATVTQALVPLNDSALPNLPVVTQVALESVPVRPCVETSAVVVPVPSSKPQAPTRPVGAPLDTVMVTEVAVAVL